MSPPRRIPTTDGDTLDELFEAPSRATRRRLLDGLRGRDRLGVGEDAAPGPRPGAEVIRLHHVHLPGPADAEFVDRDVGARAVGRGPRFRDIRPALDLFAGHAGALPAEWP